MKIKAFQLKLNIFMLLFISVLLLVNCEKEDIYENEDTPESSITELQEKRLDSVLKAIPDKMISNLSGYYKANDGGHYYIRHIGNNVYWFGEHPTGNWANIFKGELVGNKITGYFYDLPKGRVAGKGVLKLSILYNGVVLTKDSGNNFGGSLWVKTIKPANLPGIRPAGFGVRNDINNITGRWIGDDGGYYYIRQIGNRVVWFGERNFVSGQPTWSNVAYGSRFYSQLWLDWVDVPKGSINSSGILRGSIDSANYITKVHSTGGFGGLSWRR
ncbi:hypothetical protein [Aquimarina sp. I32.4]|uniref:hypothetical protein n=1 Tax=Aquimarina sp. I32.4 TaxID=2053903 RepID=UPI0011AFC00B|nr:hypothetical protein [Aquimarina sp. I32.4]